MPAKVDVGFVLSSLRRLASKSVRDGMARFAIPSDNALGVSVATLRKEAKRIGRESLACRVTSPGQTC
jgi:hypothetical protein